VTILAPEDGEVFELNSSDEAAILAGIAEAERGEVVNASDLFAQINNS
jgi:predicted transcriptional regulator